MLLPNQTTYVCWHPGNKEYYTSKGYIFTKMKEPFEVRVEDLPTQSHAVVKVECDFCGEIIDVKYQNYINRGNLSDGYACTKCKHKKAKISVENKYGVENVFQTDECKEKAMATSLEKYGVPYTAQSELVKSKAKETFLDRYGTTCYLKTDECKEKIRKTNLEKYGCAVPTQNPEIYKKVKESLISKYGGVGMGSKETAAKILGSMYQNGTCATSRPQIELAEKLREIYGECEMNCPCGRYSLDCMLVLNGVKIDVEFDGQYWHKDRGRADYLRDMFVRSQGYKIFRIKGNSKIPSDDEISQCISQLVNSDRYFIKIETDMKQKI